ncbi:hypothetical protein EGW08_008147 [Elysia chlorotica]|uniref:Uncharacterized protein n=1 Tax=Elysia chlorotica TaxID=188477 RepID=A0A3S1BM74_ELYCH|nr:hypothetical protein EGW08_008147 [Elysia chlorotica]
MSKESSNCANQQTPFDWRGRRVNRACYNSTTPPSAAVSEVFSLALLPFPHTGTNARRSITRLMMAIGYISGLCSVPHAPLLAPLCNSRGPTVCLSPAAVVWPGSAPVLLLLCGQALPQSCCCCVARLCLSTAVVVWPGSASVLLLLCGQALPQSCCCCVARLCPSTAAVVWPGSASVLLLLCGQALPQSCCCCVARLCLSPAAVVWPGSAPTSPGGTHAKTVGAETNSQVTEKTTWGRAKGSQS